ncbi:hypothetical protein [Hydrogenophaga taeniospiralis]|uniref:hypothetical protein n=1 Tax=Hydrogenophaga taeniospiralis TaxID=65656 RepID=UPI0012F76C0B|nr:hypothetical protein [Hydrogenophaga taeniospiralis]
MKKQMIKKTPYDRKILWGGGLFSVVIFFIHLSVYFLSISEVESAQSFVRGISEFMSRVVPGAWFYEVQNRAFHVPYSQLLVSIFFTIPSVFLAAKSMALYDVNQAGILKKVDGIFNLKVNISILLLVGLIVLFLPPTGFIGGAYKTYFGIFAPFRYALAALIVGYAVRVLFTQVEGRAS